MQRSVMHAPTIFFLLIAAIMKRGKNIASFFAPVNKKVKETAVRETSQGIERAEEQEEGESEEVGERAFDESEGSDTEREISESEKDEEEGEEEENIQRQREKQPEVQQVNPCGSSTAGL